MASSIVHAIMYWELNFFQHSVQHCKPTSDIVYLIVASNVFNKIIAIVFLFGIALGNCH